MRLLVCNVHQPLRVSIPKVALMWRAQMNLSLVQRILNLVREDACRQARNNLLDSGLMRDLENVVVNQTVITQESEFVLHVLEQTSD